MSPPSRTPRVPGEISDAIIDHLHDDRASLGICGMVCSQWLGRSRFHLFYTVRLCPWRVEHFICLLYSPACTFSLYVRRIEMNCYQIHSRNSEMRLYRTLSVLRLASLPHIQSFRLRNVDWTTLSLAERAYISQRLSCFTELTTLELDNVVFHDLRDVIALLCCFPLVTNFYAHVRFLKYLEHAVSSAESLRLPRGLQALELNAEESIPVILSCLCAHYQLAPVAPLGIQTLKLHNITFNDLPYIRNALDVLEASLHHVLFSFSTKKEKDHCTLPADVVRCLSLSKQKNLRILEIEDIDLTASRSLSSMVNYILAALLGTLPSDCAERIVLRFSIRAADALKSVKWASLDKVLVGNQMDSLERVDIGADYCDENLKIPVETYIRKSLPGLVSRELLSFEILHRCKNDAGTYLAYSGRSKE